MKKILEKLNSGSWIFLLSMIIIYSFLIIFKFDLGIKVIRQFLILLVKIIPVFILVIFLLFIFNLFLSPRKIAKLLGKESGIKGWLLAIGGGIISTGPIYMWYPLLKDLRDKGMRNAYLVAFLYNRAIKPALLPMMIYYFGFPLVTILCIYMILFSIINGLLVEKVIKNNL